MKTRMESWLVSKLVKKRPPIDRRRFLPVFPITELQQTATAKDKSCTYISNENRRCSLFSRWINPAAISNSKPFGSSHPKTSAAKKPLLLGGAGHQSQDSNFMPRAHPIGVVRRLRKLIPEEAKLQIYKAAILLWHFYKASDQQKLEWLNHRGLRASQRSFDVLISREGKKEQRRSEPRRDWGEEMVKRTPASRRRSHGKNFFT